VKLGLLFYKVKDHRHFSGKHRTELIETLAVTRISVLSVLSRVLVLHALQMMKLAAHPKAEYWVRNIIIQTSQDNLSELKNLTDAKGDYFCMNKLLYDDIRSESIRQDIIRHLKKEAAIQHAHMLMNTKKAKLRRVKAWRKILSDVDDTLYCSGGSYPAGVDKRFGKKVVYPGVLSFYRELDLGLHGPEVWPENAVGNLVFLSARPHLYKDVSEKQNFAKFEKLKCRGMHTNPSLLAGDIASGKTYVLQNDMEPLAIKKFQNFQRYVSIYPEFKHVFVGDNGQGDVRAGDLMFSSFPNHLEALYVHVVKPINQTHGYAPEQWHKKGLKPCFFTTYPDAALDAAKRNPPLIRVSGLRRVCEDAIKDFKLIEPKKWPSNAHYVDRLGELNQGIWRSNQYILSKKEVEVPLIESERLWNDGQKVKTPYGNAKIVSFDPIFDMYEVLIDWRPLDIQVAEQREDDEMNASSRSNIGNRISNENSSTLETVLEMKEVDEDIIKMNENIDNSFKIPIRESPNSDSQSEQNSLHTDGLNSKSETLDMEKKVTSKSKISSSVEDYTSSEDLLDRNESIFLINEGPLSISARIQGKDISKCVPASLPELKKDKRSSIFSFWGTGEDRSKIKEKFYPGNECNTSFGTGIVKEYRKENKIVVVKMREWSAITYLQESDVELITKGLLTSIFSSSFRKSSPIDGNVEREKQSKELTFPHVTGTTIYSPFGIGVVTRPIPLEKSKSSPSKALQRSNSFSSLEKTDIRTIGISLTEWRLANNTHPILYCTSETAMEWKSMKLNKDKGLLFSVFGTIVSETVRKFTSGPSREMKAPTKLNDIVFERYFKDGACVSTLFGEGRVESFREKDGFYVVNINSWAMKGDSHPTAFLQREALSYRLASGCSEGYPVLTNYGLTGNLASFEPTSGVHMVTVPSAGMVCYLQPEQIVKPIKAAVDEDVLTPYGEGTVVKLRINDNIFEITMKGWNAKLYAVGESFDRDDGVRNNDEPFGMNWLLRWMFFSSDNKKMASGSQRSHTNSVASMSVRSMTK